MMISRGQGLKETLKSNTLFQTCVRYRASYISRRLCWLNRSNHTSTFSPESLQRSVL